MGSSGLKSLVTVSLVLVAIIGVVDVRFASAQVPGRIPAATPAKGYIGIAWMVRDPMETDYLRRRAPVVFSVQPCMGGLQPGDCNGRDARDGPAFPDLEAVYSMVVKRGNDRIEAEIGHSRSGGDSATREMVRCAPRRSLVDRRITSVVSQAMAVAGLTTLVVFPACDEAAEHDGYA